YRRVLLQGSGEGAPCGGCDRSARRRRSAFHQGSARRLISCSHSRPRRRVTMRVYTVHATVASGADLAAADKFVFVRDGFHFWAAVATVIWLLWHRLWLVLIGWIALTLAINFGMGALGAGRCRAANGDRSTSWSPTTSKPPSAASSIAGLPGRAAPTTNGRSIAAAR